MKRESGILLSVTSLPSKYGIGCFDENAYRFVDWLAQAGQTYWQILPLGATSHGAAYDSPYQACSVFAGNPYFISLDELKKEGVLTAAECKAAQVESTARVDYETLHETRLPLLKKAYQRSKVTDNPDFQIFARENAWWLDDYALYMAVKEFFGNVSSRDWPEDIRMHYGPALDYYREKLYFDIEFHKYLQFKFMEQWQKLKKYANDRHIRIVGDIPIYASPDGADVWANPELFQLDEEHLPKRIAGCPPDSFNEDGQVWGNPLYNWEYHKQTGYQWWTTRMWYSYKLYDVVRIDHFRGFDAYFAIPADTGLATEGEWISGPGMELFDALKRNLGDRDVIAEDLGHITDSVRKLVKDSGFPNMKVLQFAFNAEDIGGTNEYLPHNYNNNCWVYTGTHDNETLSGWFMGMSRAQKKFIRNYMVDQTTPDEKMHRRIIDMAMMSAARTCIVPLQDFLGLDNKNRMNLPGTVGENWRWRLLPGKTTKALAKELLAVTMRYARANWAALDALKERSVKNDAQNETSAPASLA